MQERGTHKQNTWNSHKLPCDVPNTFISREKKSRHNLAGTIKLQDPLYVMQATWDTRLWHDARDNHTRTRGDGYRLEEDMGGWERRAGERRVGSRTVSTASKVATVSQIAAPQGSRGLICVWVRRHSAGPPSSLRKWRQFRGSQPPMDGEV